MVDVNSKIMTQKELAEYIARKGSEYLNLQYPLHGIVGRRGEKMKYLVAVIKNYTVLTDEEISDILGYASNNAISVVWLKMRDSLSPDVYGFDKIKFIYKQLINYLNLEDYENKGTNLQKEKGHNGKVVIQRSQVRI